MDLVKHKNIRLKILEILQLHPRLEMHIISPLLLPIGIHHNNQLMGVLQELLKLMIPLNWLRGFGEFVLESEVVFRIVFFEAVFEVVDDVE